MRLKLAVGRCRLQVVSNFPACCGSSYHGLGGGREDDDRLISKCETYTSKNCDALAVHSCLCLCLFFRLIKRLFWRWWYYDVVTQMPACVVGLGIHFQYWPLIIHNQTQYCRHHHHHSALDDDFSTVQCITPQYQNRCLDLVWYCIIIIIIVKLDQIIYKYWNETTGFYESLAFARFGSVWWVLWLGWVSWVW